MFRGEMGYPADGFPPALQKKILKDRAPIEGRAGAHLPDVDLEAARVAAEKAAGRQVDDNDLASYLMYPKVFAEFAAHQSHYGNVSALPTPVFFYGLHEKEEVAIDIDKGKTLVIQLTGRADADEEGVAHLFFELNGQPRPMHILKTGLAAKKARSKAEDGNPNHVAAPMPGAITTVSVKPGQKVSRGGPLVSIEAMKMETAVTAERDATVVRVLVSPGDRVEPKDLLIELA
jgi:pyruvate carboxylase